MSSTAKDISSKDLLDQILTSLEDSKAEDVINISLKGKSEIADYMVICSGRSTRQVTAMAEKVADHLKHEYHIFPKGLHVPAVNPKSGLSRSYKFQVRG